MSQEESKIPTCDHCNESVEYFLKFTCKACGGTFCSDHRSPESHGCQGRKEEAEKTEDVPPADELVKVESQVKEVKEKDPGLKPKCYYCEKVSTDSGERFFCDFCYHVFCQAHWAPEDHECPRKYNS